MPRYTICPYYIDESRKTISCEDVCRSFDTINAKWAWMDMYCDSWDWMRCPYAADRAEAYSRYEKGDAMALENQEIEALKKEIESLLRKLGRSNKRIERQQKKIDELRAVNQSFINVNNSLENQKKEFYKRWRSAQDELDKGNEIVLAELQKLVEIYEQRMAYLIDTYCPDKKLRERDVEEWAKGREFAIIYSKIEDEEAGIEGEPAWKVVFKKDEPDTDIQGEEQE